MASPRVDGAGLRQGIFSRQHIHRLIKHKKFPAPAKLGENTNAWLEAEILAWCEGRLAKCSRMQVMIWCPAVSEGSCSDLDRYSMRAAVSAW